MSEKYKGWLYFDGTLRMWIEEQAKYGRKFVWAERQMIEIGVTKLDYAYAHEPGSPETEVAIANSSLAPIVLYDSRFRLP